MLLKYLTIGLLASLSPFHSRLVNRILFNIDWMIIYKIFSYNSLQIKSTIFHKIICLKPMSPRLQTRHRSSYKTTNNVLLIKVHYTRAVPMVTANRHSEQ